MSDPRCVSTAVVLIPSDSFPLEVGRRLAYFYRLAMKELLDRLFPALQELDHGDDPENLCTTTVYSSIHSIRCSFELSVTVRHPAEMGSRNVERCIEHHLLPHLSAHVKEIFIDNARFPFHVDQEGTVCFGLGSTIAQYFGRVEQVTKIDNAYALYV